MTNKNNMALIDVAYDIMKNGSLKEVVEFKVIFAQVAETLGLTESEKTEKLAQFYTDLNIDGRFMFTPEKRWGLKSWFLVDQIDEEIVSTTKTKKKQSVEEDFDSIEDIEREEYSFEEEVEEDEDEDEDEVEVVKEISELDALEDDEFKSEEDDEDGEEISESLEELASEELEEEEDFE